MLLYGFPAISLHYLFASSTTWREIQVARGYGEKKKKNTGLCGQRNTFLSQGTHKVHDKMKTSEMKAVFQVFFFPPWSNVGEWSMKQNIQPTRGRCDTFKSSSMKAIFQILATVFYIKYKQYSARCHTLCKSGKNDICSISGDSLFLICSFFFIMYTTNISIFMKQHSHTTRHSLRVYFLSGQDEATQSDGKVHWLLSR